MTSGKVGANVARGLRRITTSLGKREGIADKPSRDGVCAADKRDGGKVSYGFLTVGRVGVGAWGVAVLQ